MKRTLTCLAVALAATTASPARADDPAPTSEQVEAAKQAFAAGDALYRSGNYVEAVAKLQESYRLSRNPFLLYNIGRTYDRLGDAPLVLFYYRKFLAAAPASAPMHDEVAKRVDELEQQHVEAAADPDARPAPAPQIEIGHQPIESARPDTAIEVIAVVPDGVTVTLLYRGSGDETFAKEVMAARGTQVVGHIPGAKAGTTIQYYLEARDPSGKLVARTGKSTSPNLVHIETPPEDPLRRRSAVIEPDPEVPAGPSSALGIAKWIATGSAVALLGTAAVTYTLAGKQHDLLVADAGTCGPPPCRAFDAGYDQGVESLGQRYNAIYKVTLVIGVGVAVGAGYLWFRELTTRRRSDKSTASWAIVPGLGGAAIAGEF